MWKEPWKETGVRFIEITAKKCVCIDGRRGEDLGISVVEVPELPDGQLFDGRRLGLWRYPEARHGSHPSRSYWRGRGTERIRCMHVRRNVGDVATGGLVNDES